MWREAKTNEPEKAIQEGQRGRRMGACRTLTPDQEEKLQAEIVGKTPDQYQYEFALWSSQAVKLHILKRFGIDMLDRTVRFYLKRWGWTPQHPIRKAYEQNPEATQEWLETTYLAIKEEAKENKGIISGTPSVFMTTPREPVLPDCSCRWFPVASGIGISRWLYPSFEIGFSRFLSSPPQ